MIRRTGFSVITLFIALVVVNCTPNQTYTDSANTPTASPSPITYPKIPTRTNTPSTYPIPVAIDSTQILQAYYHLGKMNTCELPCFLGIIPGKTLWNDAKFLLAPYTESIRIGLEDSQNNTQFYVIKLDPQRLNLELDFVVELEKGMIYLLGMRNKTPLSEFLNSLGPPSQVLISSAGAGGMETTPGFSLSIHYPQIGVLASLDGTLKIANEKGVICANALGQISIVYLWSPDMMSYEHAASYTGANKLSYGKIENISDTTIEEFYENFSTEKSNYCIRLNN